MEQERLGKLLDKFIKLVCREEENGWEDGTDAIKKEHFVQYFEELRETFELALRIKECVVHGGCSESLEGQELFGALYDQIDEDATGTISQDAFKCYFLEKKILLLVDSVRKTDDMGSEANRLDIRKDGNEIEENYDDDEYEDEGNEGNGDEDDEYDDDDFEANDEDDANDPENVELIRLLRDKTSFQNNDNAARETQLRAVFGYIDSKYGDGNGKVSRKEIVRASNKNPVLRSALHDWLGLPESPLSRESVVDKDGPIAQAFRDLGSYDGKDHVTFDQFFSYVDTKCRKTPGGQEAGVGNKVETLDAIAEVNKSDTAKATPEMLSGGEIAGEWTSRDAPTNLAPTHLLLPKGFSQTGSDVAKHPQRDPIHLSTDDSILKTYLTRLVLGDMINAQSHLSTRTTFSCLIPPEEAKAKEQQIREFSEADFENQFREKPKSLQISERELMSEFDQVYMHFIQSLTQITQQRERPHRNSTSKDRRLLEKAFADSLRECFSDPSIISLLRRATKLRLKQRQGATRRAPRISDTNN